MDEIFSLVLNQSWEAIDLKTGDSVLIPKGSYQAVRRLHRATRNAEEEPYLVVTVQQEGKKVLVGMREAYWRHWEGHHIPELRVTIREWKGKSPLPPQKKP